LAEEIDFEGLCNYVQSDVFFDDVHTRLMSGNSKERGRARESIEKSISFFACTHQNCPTDDRWVVFNHFAGHALDSIRNPLSHCGMIICTNENLYF